MNFTKLQGTGNDFILIDAREKRRDWGKLAVAMCHRNFGVGGAGILLLLPSRRRSAVARMSIYNADGSYAEASGNGLRCFARYLLNVGLVPANARRFVVETGAGLREVRPQRVRGRVVAFQTSLGRLNGLGGRLLKRSGRAAKAWFMTTARALRIWSALP